MEHGFRKVSDPQTFFLLASSATKVKKAVEHIFLRSPVVKSSVSTEQEIYYNRWEKLNLDFLQSQPKVIMALEKKMKNGGTLPPNTSMLVLKDLVGTAVIWRSEPTGTGS